MPRTAAETDDLSAIGPDRPIRCPVCRQPTTRYAREAYVRRLQALGLTRCDAEDVCACPLATEMQAIRREFEELIRAGREAAASANLNPHLSVDSAPE